MIRLVPLEAAHLQAMPPERPEDPVYMACHRHCLDGLERYLVPGCSWALLEGEEAVACGGLIPFARHVGELWVKQAPAAGGRQRSLARHLLTKVEAIATVVRRIEACVAADDLRTLRLMHWLGFEIEGRRRAFGFDGADYFLLARIT